MDLTFVVDSSGSICDDKSENRVTTGRLFSLSYMILSKDMIIGVNDVRVALILFDTDAYIKWNLMA